MIGMVLREGLGSRLDGILDKLIHFVLFSQLSLLEILQPAIDLAENGFPVAPISAYHWEWGAADLMNPKNLYGKDMLLNNRAPRTGEIMRMPILAKTFKVSTNTDLYRVSFKVNKYTGVWGRGAGTSCTCR